MTSTGFRYYIVIHDHVKTEPDKFCLDAYEEDARKVVSRVLDQFIANGHFIIHRQQTHGDTWFAVQADSIAVVQLLTIGLN